MEGKRKKVKSQVLLFDLYLFITKENACSRIVNGRIVDGSGAFHRKRKRLIDDFPYGKIDLHLLNEDNLFLIFQMYLLKVDLYQQLV